MNESAKLSRRSLSALVGAALVPVASPLTSAQAEPAGDDAEAAEAVRRNAGLIAKVAVPRSTEPASRFEA